LTVGDDADILRPREATLFAARRDLVTHSLDNPAWTALTTLQAHLAVGGDLARRYPEELTSIAAVARPEHDTLDELATLIADGGSTSLPATFASIVPLIRPPLALTFTTTLVQMVCERRVSLAAQRRGTLPARRA
jgi:hypothetical protein